MGALEKPSGEITPDASFIPTARQSWVRVTRRAGTKHANNETSTSSAERVAPAGHGAAAIAQTKAYVVKRRFDDSDAASIAAIFFGLLEAAGFTARFAERFIGREAGGYIFPSFLVDVELRLFT